MTGLAPGVYFLYVGAHSTVTGQWVQFAWSFTATAHPISGVETPASGASVGQPFALSGWAIDQAAATGTGVDYVDVWAYPNPGSGASAVYWGPTTLGGSRPAVGAQYGAQFTNSGFTLTVTGKAAGSYLMQVGIRSAVTGTWTIQTRQAYVDLPTVALLIDRQGTGTGGVSASGLTCPGGSGTQAVPCGASYTLQTVVTLVPQPDAGSSFGGWTGACSGLGACQLTMSQARFASAQFIKAPSTLAPSYYHVDAIGSVRAITDQSGATVIRHDYFPFGEDTQPLTGDPMRFGGTELDPESGLNYMVARNYRNTWGRFLSVDPVGGSLTNPQQWNGYVYGLNNPLRFVDPSGTMSTSTDPFQGLEGNPCNGADDTCFDGSEYYCFVNPGCSANGPRGPSAEQLRSESAHDVGVGFAMSAYGTVHSRGAYGEGYDVGLGSDGNVSSTGYRDVFDSRNNQLTAQTGVLLSGKVDPTLVMVLASASTNPFAGVAAGAGMLAVKYAGPTAKLVAGAAKQFPKLALKGKDLHHIIPKYLCHPQSLGPLCKEVVPVAKAYHQLITNAFRSAWKYGKGRKPELEELERILNEVYSKLPLPPQ